MDNGKGRIRLGEHVTPVQKGLVLIWASGILSLKVITASSEVILSQLGSCSWTSRLMRTKAKIYCLCIASLFCCHEIWLECGFLFFYFFFFFLRDLSNIFCIIIRFLNKS